MVFSIAFLAFALSAPPLVPQRLWLERLAFIVPGTAATRWLLIGDAVCLIAVGLAARKPLVATPVALVLGFLALNVLAMAVTDFYLGLAIFHLSTGVATAALVRRARWFGVALVLAAVLLGVTT